MQREDIGWVIDFGMMDEKSATAYAAPFKVVEVQVKGERQSRRDPGQAVRWWLHARPSPVYRLYLLKGSSRNRVGDFEAF